jgi:hypothetical protein
MLPRQAQRFEQARQRFAEVHQPTKTTLLPLAFSHPAPSRREAGKYRLNAVIQIRWNRLSGGAEGDDPDIEAFLVQGA